MVCQLVNPEACRTLAWRRNFRRKEPLRGYIIIESSDDIEIDDSLGERRYDGKKPAVRSVFKGRLEGLE